MKFELKGNWGTTIVVLFWALIILGAVSIGYGFYYLHSPHPQTNPKTIHEGVTLFIPGSLYVSEVNITASTTDVFASFNTFNLTMHIQFSNAQSISKAYFLIIPTSFNSSVLSTTDSIQKYVTTSLAEGNGFNLTNTIKNYSASSVNEFPVRATADFSISDDGEYTIMSVILPNDGTFEIGHVDQTLLNVLPYSSYLEAESVREVAQSTVIQLWLSYIVLGFTSVVSSFTLSQVVDVKQKPERKTTMIWLLVLLVVLTTLWFIFFSRVEFGVTYVFL